MAEKKLSATDFRQPNSNGGTINEKTKLPLSFVIPLVACTVSAVFAIANAVNEHDRLRRDNAELEGHLQELSDRLTVVEDSRFKGEDMDRWLERLTWSWTDYTKREGHKYKPVVPPWRAEDSFAPRAIRVDEEGGN